jgi:uncharacterized heparinase superfamily protein
MGARARTPPVSAATLLAAIAAAPGRRLALEWAGTPFHDTALSGGRPRGLGARVKSFRPTDPANGERLLAGEYLFGGEAMRLGPGADPFDGLTPSRRFAEALQSFAWLGDLMALGERGAAEGLRLMLAWRRLFRHWSPFAWEEALLRRRVAALACALPALAAAASEAETAAILSDVSRQARRLLSEGGNPAGAAERAAVAAIGAAALSGPGPARLLAKALRRLERLLPDAVMPDGAHATRSPEAGLELLADLASLDDALTQRGLPPGPELSRAIDALSAATRFFALADGRLASAQGGLDAAGTRIAAALAHDDDERAVPEALQDGGYHRLGAGELQLMVDAGAPAQGDWSGSAQARPGAFELLARGRRLVVGGAHESVLLDDTTVAAPLHGFAAWALGPRLEGGRFRVTPRRSEGDGVTLLEISHDAWLARLGLRAERRLYLDSATAELRGEERFIPTRRLRGDAKRFAPYAVAFLLHPEVRAQVSLDGKSAVIRWGNEAGWQLRTDASAVSLERAEHWLDGERRGTTRVVLSGVFRLGVGGRVRWKIARA